MQSNRWRRQRVQLALNLLGSALTSARLVVDLGGGNGAYAVLLKETLPGIDIVVADIDEMALREASSLGFKTVLFQEQQPLPFDDNECDIVFCNSVIEHVTCAKSQVWSQQNDQVFKTAAEQQQASFAAEIRRTSRGYFVQTPARHFPIESHTWLRLVQYLPRRWLIPLLNRTNRTWVKQTTPDWHLLDLRAMKALFPDAQIIIERVFGLPKSLIACRVPQQFRMRSGSRC